MTLILGEQPAPLYPCKAGEPCPIRYYKLQACDMVTWHFGDGTPDVTVASSYFVTHTYANPGVYSATATIENTLGSKQGGGDVTVSPNPATATYIEFAPSTITVSETAGSMTFTLARSGNLNTTTKVHYQDQSSALSGDVTFAPGETAKSFTRKVVDDHAYGGDAGGNVVATATDGTLFRGGTAHYTITETNPRPTATVADAIVREGATTADVVVDVSGLFSFSPQFWGITTDDHIGPASCSLPVGATQCVLHFPIAEPDQTFTVKVSAQPGPTFLRDTATVTVKKLTPKSFTAEPTSIRVSAGTDGTVKISMQPASAAAQTVTMWSTRPDIATAPESLTIPAGDSATFDVHALAGGTATVWIVTSDGVSLPVDVTVVVPRRRASR